MAGHGITFSATGNITSPPWATPQTNPSLQQVIYVLGLSAENTGAGAGAVIIRDGGASGNIVTGGPVPAQASSVPGIIDLNFPNPRVVLNGLYVEIDGGTATVTGTIWVK